MGQMDSRFVGDTVMTVPELIGSIELFEERVRNDEQVEQVLWAWPEKSDVIMYDSRIPFRGTQEDFAYLLTILKAHEPDREEIRKLKKKNEELSSQLHEQNFLENQPIINMKTRMKLEMEVFHLKQMLKISEKTSNDILERIMEEAVREKEEKWKTEMEEKDKRIKELEDRFSTMGSQNSELEQLRAKLAQLEVNQTQKKRKMARKTTMAVSESEDSDGWSRLDKDETDKEV